MKEKHSRPSLSGTGSLDGKEAEHLHHCPECRMDFTLYEKIMNGNRRTLDPQREALMREALQRKISETATRHNREKRPAWRSRLHPVPLCGLAAACLVAVLLLVLTPPVPGADILFETTTPGIVTSPHRDNRAGLPFQASDTGASAISFSDGKGMDFRFAGPGSFSLDKDATGTGRILVLNGGQVLVSVRPGTSGPLEIRVPDASIRVVGTGFTVLVRETTTIVALFHGKLAVARHGKTQPLEAGQAARIDGTGITVTNEWQPLLEEPERVRCAAFFTNLPALSQPGPAPTSQPTVPTEKKRQYQRIVLADGNTLEGLLVSQDETTIVLLSGSAKYYIERSNIRRISYFSK